MSKLEAKLKQCLNKIIGKSFQSKLLKKEREKSNNKNNKDKGNMNKQNTLLKKQLKEKK